MHLSIQHAGLLTSLIGGAGGNSPQTTAGGEEFSSLLSSLLGSGIQGGIETVQALTNSPAVIPVGSVSGQTAFAVKPGVLPTAAPVTRVIQSGESATATDAAVEMIPAVITVQSGEGKVIDIPVLVGRLDTSSGDTSGSSEREISVSAGLLVILNPTDTPLTNAGEDTEPTVYTYTFASPGNGSWNLAPTVSHAKLIHTDAVLGDGTSHADGFDSSGKHVIETQENRTPSTQPQSGIESPPPSGAEIPRIVHIGPQNSDAAGNQPHAAGTTHEAGITHAVEPVGAEAVSTQTKAVNMLAGMQALETRMTFEAIPEARLIIQSPPEHETVSPAEAVTNRATHSSIDAEIIGDTAARNSDVSNEADIMVFRTPDGHATLSVPSSRVASAHESSILRLLEALAADGGRVEAVFTFLSDDTGALSNSTGSPIVPFDAHAVQTAASKAVANPVESVNAGAAPDEAVSPEPIRIVIDHGNTVFRYQAPRIETAESVRAGQPIAIQSPTSEHEQFADADIVPAAETATKPSRVGIPELQPEVVSRAATARHDLRAEETLFAGTPAAVVNDANGTEGANAVEGQKTSGASSEKIKLTVPSAPVAEKAAADLRSEAPEAVSRPITSAATSMKTDTPATYKSEPEAVEAEQKSPVPNDTVSRSDARRPESIIAAKTDQSGQSVPPRDDSARVMVSAGQRSVRYVDSSALATATASASDTVISGEGAVASGGFADASVPAAADIQPRVDTASTGGVTVQGRDAKQSIDMKAVRATDGRQTVKPERNTGDTVTASMANDIPETVATETGDATASSDSVKVGHASKTAVHASDAQVDKKSGQARGDGDGTSEPVIKTAERTPSVVDGRAGRIVHERHEALTEPIASTPVTDTAVSGYHVDHTAAAEPETGIPDIPHTSARLAANDSASTGIPVEYTAPNEENLRNAPEAVSAGSVKTAAVKGIPDPGKTEQAESQPAAHAVKVANMDNPALNTKPSAFSSRNGTGSASEPFEAVETPGLANPEATEISAADTTVRHKLTDAASTANKGASEPAASASAGSAGSTRVPSEAESRTYASSLDDSHRHDRIMDSADTGRGNHSDSGSMDSDGEGRKFDIAFAAGKNAAASTPDVTGMTAGFESAFRSAAFAESDTTMDERPAVNSVVHGVGQGDMSAEPASLPSVSSKTLASVPPDYDEKILTSIVRHATLMQKNGQSSAVIRLEPPNLGKLKLEIVTEQSKITGRITVESNEVKQIVENRLAELRHNLNQNGLKVESFDVQVGHNGGTDAWAHREKNEHGTRAMHYGAFGGSQRGSAGAAATAAPQAVRAGIHQTGMIDVMI